MKKNDVIFAISVLLIAGLITIWYGMLGKQEAGQITITVDKEVYGTYLLSEDQEISINDTNYLVIKEGTADMIDATCPNKECVHQKEISKRGEAITCLPNKVIVEVESAEDGEYDAVTN